MNCESVSARSAMASILVRESGDVLVGARRHRGAEARERVRDRRGVLLGHGASAGGAQPLDQEAELVLERLADLAAYRGGHRPQFALERPQRLLAGLVEELLVGIARLALVGGAGAQALVDPPTSASRAI